MTVNIGILQSAGPDPVELQQRQQEARRRAQAKRHVLQQQARPPRTPDPVEGRQHVDVQTELYLEELSDRVEEADVECQTDAFLDRPPSPLFIPAKTGVDCETQILEGEVTLFYYFISLFVLDGTYDTPHCGTIIYMESC